MSTKAIHHQGKSFPLGATLGPGGANFSVFAKHSTAAQLLLFDRVTVSLDRDAWGAPRRYVLEGDLSDLVAQGLPSSCTAPLIAPQRALGTLEISARRPHAYSQDDAQLLAGIA